MATVSAGLGHGNARLAFSHFFGTWSFHRPDCRKQSRERECLQRLSEHLSPGGPDHIGRKQGLRGLQAW